MKGPVAAVPAAVSAPVRDRKQLSPALVAAGTTLGIVALLAILYLFVLPSKRISRAAQVPPQFEKVPVSQSPHPLAKHVEITGLRITDAAGGRAKVYLLVVNHSTAQLPEMKMKVDVQSPAGSLFEFDLPLRTLGPHESRELSTQVKTSLKPYELPDWQSLRARFQMVSEP
ncbi:MAG: hypothetical protein WKF37_02340 [Bryobacteraceae bacterium]